MKKRIITPIVVLSIVLLVYLLFTVDLSTMPSKAYDFVMRSEFRLVLPQDIAELNKNLELIAEALDSANPKCGNIREFSNQFSELKDQRKGRFIFQLNELKKETILLYEAILAHQDCAYKPFVIDYVQRLQVKNNYFLANITSLGNNTVIRIKNNGNEEVKPVLIVNGVDNTNLRSIAQRLASENLTDEEKAIRIWDFVKGHKYPANNPTKYVAKDSIDLINAWGYGNCGVTARTVVDLARLSGLKAREHRLGSHIVSEIYYGDAWHVFDADSKVYYLKNDGTIAGVDDIEKDLSLLSKTKSEVYSQEYLEKAYRTTDNNVVFNYEPKHIDKEIRYTLRPSESVIFLNDNNHRYFSGVNYEEPQEYSNSYFIYEPKSYEKVLSFTYPYPIIGSILTGQSDQTSIYFSSNLGRWKKIYSGSGEFIVDLTEWFSNGYGIPDNNYHLFFTKSASNLRIVTEVQVSSKSLPLLSPGVNTVELTDQSNNGDQKIDIEFGFNSNAAITS